MSRIVKDQNHPQFTDNESFWIGVDGIITSVKSQPKSTVLDLTVNFRFKKRRKSNRLYRGWRFNSRCEAHWLVSAWRSFLKARDPWIDPSNSILWSLSLWRLVSLHLIPQRAPQARHISMSSFLRYRIPKIVCRRNLASPQQEPDQTS